MQILGHIFQEPIASAVLNMMQRWGEGCAERASVQMELYEYAPTERATCSKNVLAWMLEYMPLNPPPPHHHHQKNPHS